MFENSKNKKCNHLLSMDIIKYIFNAKTKLALPWEKYKICFKYISSLSRLFMYDQKIHLRKNTWNNALSYDERLHRIWKAEIVIPSLKTIKSLEEINIWKHIVLEEIDQKGKIQSCTWLEHLYHLQTKNIYIMDNHNHALCFRIMHTKRLQNWAFTRKNSNPWNVQNIQLLHIDQHSDLNTPPLTIQSYLEKQWVSEHTYNEKDIRTYTNHICQISTFIKPFLELYPSTRFQWIKSEHELLTFEKDMQGTDLCILDIDLDFWAPEMSIENYDTTISITRRLMKKADIITIATSPMFIEQAYAIQLLQELFSK